MNNLDKLYTDSGFQTEAFINGYTNYLITLLQQLDTKRIAECIEQLEEARQNSNTIFVIGNGGSAATASHIGNDFGLAVLKKTTNPNNKSYRALALTDNISVISAIGNDSSYDDIFLDQLKVHYRKGDKLIVISASGNSPNLVKAAQWFKEKGGIVMGWLGFDGGKLSEIAQIPLVVTTPKGEYAPVEDIHLIINHIIVTWMQFHIMKEDGTI
ncbi:MAG: SIS domain-containing protein [Candidatus Pedobacter colombiensis]|uniref:SIS domain-containing protein n=1 Tax=Candidatus Pedobacter colombiensis TaxID=3121371 RepID=A0AAJ5W9Q7_9SPHI|nr:SIS domain-containing protein [Pedobacter sp.]WEK19660.1 MAG: SIS domain-containing protein [Pedobacter sp.]